LKGIRRDHGAIRECHTKVALNSVLTDSVMAGAIVTNPVREIALRRMKRICLQKDLRDPVICWPPPASVAASYWRFGGRTLTSTTGWPQCPDSSSG
jgi:hypothetical protein